MPKTVQDQIGKLERRIDAFEEHVGVHLAEVEGKVEAFEKRKRTPLAMAHGATIEVDLETKRQMNITAQALGLRSGEELSQIVLHAFLDMYEEDECSIIFPLTLQQVPAA